MDDQGNKWFEETRAKHFICTNNEKKNNFFHEGNLKTFTNIKTFEEMSYMSHDKFRTSKFSDTTSEKK